MTDPAKTRRTAHRITYYAIMTSLVYVLSAAESLIPYPAPTPGIKLGLANIVTLILLLNNNNLLYIIIVILLRCVLAAFSFGAFSTLLFSLAGGIVSCMIMWFLLHFNCAFSTMGISVAGALAHNLAQLAAAALIARNPAIFAYMPALLIAGVAAGAATGFIAAKMHKIIKTIIK